ncbi:MAG: PHP domain-containing protein [Actinomycetota bacterium]|nr:PHP domain-containing protein [Actinomycetota bacterium]
MHIKSSGGMEADGECTSEKEPPTFDLQSHSHHSDGVLAPGAVVAAAAQAGVELLALTDHDTVDGVQEATSAARALGLALIAAVEISANDAGQHDVHVLGYLIDARDETLSARLSGYRGERGRRAQAMAEALRELGFELDEGWLRERAASGRSVGRPHLAQAVVGAPGNAQRLTAEGCLGASAFLEAYLIEGRPAFIPRQAPSVANAIEAIHDAGGLAVWAHPFWDVQDPRAVLDAIDRFRSCGLDGVECFYATHLRDQAVLLADRCAELGLLSTGSADFHGPCHPRFSRFRAFSTFGRGAVLGPIAG